MTDNKSNFKLTFPENLKKYSEKLTTDTYSFDDLADFSHEREKIQRLTEKRLETELKIDYSNFANHVFFNSAVNKFNKIRDKILDEYPYNGKGIDKENFELSGTNYQKYILEQWPRAVCFTHFNGTDQFITASDYEGKLLLGSSSLYISAWILPKDDATAANPGEHYLLELFSSSVSPTKEHGYRMWISGGLDPHVNFTLYSGSTTAAVSASLTKFISTWTNIAVIYDNPADKLLMYISSALTDSVAAVFKPIEYTPRTLYIGSGTLQTANRKVDLYTGSLNELRICHTASELYHQRNYLQPIDAEEFVQLHYNFNEGIMGLNSFDKTIVDYSKNALHGVVTNYTPTFRISGAVMPCDPGNVILYSEHSGVMAFTSSYYTSASLYDRTNKSYIYRLVPVDVLEMDEKNNDLLKPFLFGMASFFDEIKLYVDQFDNLRITNYDDYDETPDLFLPFLKRYFGFKVTEIFADASPLEFLLGENVLSTGSLTTKVSEVRDQFWRRILNNLPYIYKSKGKRTSIDALMNSVGINPSVYKIREFGRSRAESYIQDQRIRKEKVVPLLGFGTGSLSSSYVKIPNVLSASKTQYTVEALVRLPWASASYSGSVLIETGSIWQFKDNDQVTGSFSLLWTTYGTGSISGTLVFTGSDGQGLKTPVLSIFDGNEINIAAGLKSNSRPFIEVRRVNYDEIEFSSSTVGAVAFSGVFTGSKYDLIIGACSGTEYCMHNTHGHIGHVKMWNSALSASELDDHTLNFESMGTKDPMSINQLIGYWPLNEYVSANASGKLYGLNDLSMNGLYPTGNLFIANKNPYEKNWLTYNILSPSFDLGWNEEKIRVKNLTELKSKDIGYDTDELALEFNFIEALNEDISRLFSSFEILNDAIGAPINKYRDEYIDLEKYRRKYFERLGDKINFIKFFNAFKWFDRKIGDAIKQLLPAKTTFIGGEQIVESHMLERPRYRYNYHIFKTPKDINESVISGNLAIFSGVDQNIIKDTTSMKGNYAAGQIEKNNSCKMNGSRRLSGALPVAPRDASYWLDSNIEKCNYKMVSSFGDGEEIVDKNKDKVVKITHTDILLSGARINSVAIDKSGSIYAAGYFLTPGSRQIWWTAKSHMTSSTSWTEVDRHSNSSSLNDEARNIAIDSNDNVYVVGYGPSGSVGNNSWIIKSSSDRGATWAYQTLNTMSGGDDQAWNIAIDSNNIIYVVGYHSGAVGKNSWLVKSSSNGVLWGNCDEYAIEDYSNSAYGIAIGNSNIVYVCGGEKDEATQLKDWLVRSSSNGKNWATVDHFTSSYIAKSIDNPLDITINSSNNIFIVGFATGSATERDSIIRKSTTGKSGSWSTVDTCNILGNSKTSLRGVASTGKIVYATGEDQTNKKLFIRKSVNEGTTWENFDDWSSGVTVFGLGIAISVSGSIYACGLSGSRGFVREYKFGESPGFFRTQYSGDTKYDKYNANTSLNSKNEYAKKELSNWENKKYPDAKHSGVFMNDKVSGPFVIPSIDTSKDSCHWFGGHKRNIKLILWGLTSSYSSASAYHTDRDINKASIMYLTGANGTELSQSIFTEVNTLLDSGSIGHLLTGETISTVNYRYNPCLSLLVSGCAQAFDRSQIKIMFRDGNSDAWTSYKDLVPFGVFLTESDRSGNRTGWFKFEYNLFSGSKQQIPKFSLLRTNTNFVLSSSTSKTYAFRDVKLEFDQPLADTGAEYMRDLDNKNIEERYINYDVLKKIED